MLYSAEVDVLRTGSDSHWRLSELERQGVETVTHTHAHTHILTDTLLRVESSCAAAGDGVSVTCQHKYIRIWPTCWQ